MGCAAGRWRRRRDDSPSPGYASEDSNVDAIRLGKTRPDRQAACRIRGDPAGIRLDSRNSEPSFVGGAQELRWRTRNGRRPRSGISSRRRLIPDTVHSVTRCPGSDSVRGAGSLFTGSHAPWTVAESRCPTITRAWISPSRPGSARADDHEVICDLQVVPQGRDAGRPVDRAPTHRQGLQHAVAAIRHGREAGPCRGVRPIHGSMTSTSGAVRLDIDGVWNQ